MRPGREPMYIPSPRDSLHRRQRPPQSSPLGKPGKARVFPRQRLGSVEEVRYVEVLDVVARKNVRVSLLHKLAPLQGTISTRRATTTGLRVGDGQSAHNRQYEPQG